MNHLETPIVSIICYAYNHEKYIRQAIEGFIMQQTNFSFEIVIHDDASTDNTAAIIKEYEAKYPQLFSAIYQNENQHSQEKGRVTKICFEAAKGKYIAMCEGDDYWTDPLKLQKQVDFLEKNPDYGLVHSDINSYHQLNGEMKCNQNKETINNNESFTKDQLFDSLINGKYVIRTATVLFRAEYLNLNKSDKNFVMGDTPLWLNISQVTKFKYFDEVLATYRILTESASKSKDKKKLDRFRLSIVEMQIYYLLKFNYHIRPLILERYNRNLLNYLLLHDQKYEPLYPLFNPTLFDKLRLRYNDNSLFRILVKKTFTFERILKESLRNLKSVK